MSAEPAIRAARLLDWYGRVARDLPWRRAPSAYTVLLSELMLQQTRVETVVPYFDRFVVRWPTIETLAAADPEDVLHAWAGLGYYSRARNLLRCAVAAVEAGGLPREPDALLALPGIGPYTAGAIASIAFGVRAPIVDGNVERVLSRLDGLLADPKREGKQAIWARARALVDAIPDDAHPGALNQGLMELGATVCTPRSPRCSVCPVADGCVARESGTPERWPTKSIKAAPKSVAAVAAVVRGPRGFLLGRRPPGLLGGMWEPLGCEVATAEDVGALVDAFRDRAGVQLVDCRWLGEVVHVFTHRRLTTTVWSGDVEGEPRALTHYTDVRWVADPETLPLSTLAHKLLALHRSPGLPLAAEPD